MRRVTTALIVMAATVAAAVAAPGGGVVADDLALYNAAVGDAEARNRAALLAIAERDRPRARAALAALREAFTALADRFGKSHILALKGEPDGVTIMVDVPMRIVTAQMMIDFGRPDVAASSLLAVCRLLVSLHVPPDPSASAACEADRPDRP
ncbi:hypothetical protein PQJ75_30010 [Rhodoplanes sp. TEM]|uniref:Uncharacterized protein n=1 Tax=Rhodoplanes tepidamans TaxID=200616 RepID=A0ABT5J938_RHOTP|nr:MULTISPECIES: hypothetical protein [Rhodoplanes]MDC7785916.1 hypothetical protein [Rhodoplanes tepidamans]MDC7987989.1 hypothetical protein [Rhodoplanes sp. TEM]MDQ0355465.1 Cys-tRNA synthase (O-phospho-L-seryl-tRNA:Cys-tRNA synthase) [Rhodoplanes tepidamans]